MDHLRGTIRFGEYESQSTKPTDPQVSKLRVHPLAQVLEESSSMSEMPTCSICKVKVQCTQNQRAGLPFADPRCEMPVLGRGYGARLSARLASVYDILLDRGPMTLVQLADIIHRPRGQIGDILDDLRNRRMVIVIGRVQEGSYKRNIYAVAPNDADV